jgi:hypothetical protein
VEVLPPVEVRPPVELRPGPPGEPIFRRRAERDPRRLPSHRARPDLRRRAVIVATAGLLVGVASAVLAATPWF